MISLYDSKEINFNNNGLVVLSDCINCTIIEELNGSYELQLEYPLLDSVERAGTITPSKIIGRNKVGEIGINQVLQKWQYLLEGNIIKADGQLFRNYHKVKTLKSIKINARHIFYDLLDNFLEDVRPTNLSGSGALDWILNHTQYAHPFTSLGDVGGSNTKYYVRKNVVEAIMGQEGIINTWGGEIVRDNFEVKLLGQRGLDRGVLVAYGKNIQGIEETLDLDGLCTRLMPLGKDGLLLTEKYIDSPYINNFPHPKIKVVEFSDCETEEALRAAGQNYFISSKCDIPQFNYKIDFLELSKTEEYKNYAVLERVYLGDTVTIKHSKLNINLKAKVIKITKNILTNRIEKIELGSFKPNIATAINNSIQDIKKEIVQVKSDYQNAIDNATNLITGSKGGNVVIRQNEDGKPYEILIMDTTDIMTAENVWRWNSGGFGHSSTGYNGPYEVAITQDGHIVASFITALQITGEQINGGTITGSILKTSNTANYLFLKNQTLDTYVDNKMQMSFGNIQMGPIVQPSIVFAPYLSPTNIAKCPNIGYTEYTGVLNDTGILTMYSDSMLRLTGKSNVSINAPGLTGDGTGGSIDMTASVVSIGSDVINIGSGDCRIDTSAGAARFQADPSTYLSIIPGDGVYIYVNGVGRKL